MERVWENFGNFIAELIKVRGPGKGGGEWNMKEAEKGEGRKGKGSEEKMGQEKGKGGNLSSLILILDSGDKSPLVQPSCITSL